MSTDRELLELAAKVAGIEGKWTEWDRAYGDYREHGIDYGGRALWNPLADDGDALRLAVKLEMRITNDYNKVVYAESYFNDDYHYAYSMITDDANDATRRAIVLAAAEIRKNMK